MSSNQTELISNKMAAILRGSHFVLAIIIFALDQFTKHLVSARIALNTGWIEIVPGFFSITHVENRGAAFSLFADGNSNWKLGMLIAFSVVAMFTVAFFLWKTGYKLSLTTIALALILGGAVGNLWDRVMHGHVTDFLHFYVGDYSWPDFNVADSAIVAGACLLILEIVFTTPAKERA